jgi:predicted Zn-dependent peptidase
MIIDGFPAPPSSDPDALPLDILQMAIAQGESCRLHRRIVRNQSLAVMTGGLNHFLRLSGMSLFFAAFTPDVAVGRVLGAIEDEIGKVKRDGIGRHEMEKIRNTVLTTRYFEMYSADHICQRLGYSETVEGGYRKWIDRINALQTLEHDSLVQAARKYWDSDRRCALYLKPRRAKPLLFTAGLARRVFAGRGKAVVDE